MHCFKLILETNVSLSLTSNPATPESPKKIIFLEYSQSLVMLNLSPNGPMLTCEENSFKKPPNFPEKFGFEDISGIPWIEIDFPEDIERAHREIIPKLSKT